MKVVVAAVLKDGKVLLVRKNKIWVFPGGKIEKGESEEEALARELKEELPGFRFTIKEKHGLFASQNSSGDPVTAVVYLVTGSGDIRPGGEIKESRWVEEFWRFRISLAVRTCCHGLRASGMLDAAD